MPTQDPAPSIIPGDVDHLSEIIAHLGAALMQVHPSDDPIIIGHVKTAHKIALAHRHPAESGNA